MEKLSNIIQGWKGLITGTGFNLPEAQRRAEICAACPNFDMDSVIAKTTGNATCKACGCVLAAKTKAMGANCPEGKWKAYKDETGT